MDNGDVYGSDETDYKQLGEKLSGWVEIPKKILSNVRWVYATNKQSIFCTNDKIISYGQVKREYQIDNIKNLIDVRITENEETCYFLYKTLNLNFKNILIFILNFMNNHYNINKRQFSRK